MKTVVWTAAGTLSNENINISRKSMKAIVLFLTKQSRVDSEEHIYIQIVCIPKEYPGIDFMMKQ